MSSSLAAWTPALTLEQLAAALLWLRRTRVWAARRNARSRRAAPYCPASPAPPTGGAAPARRSTALPPVPCPPRLVWPRARSPAPPRAAGQPGALRSARRRRRRSTRAWSACARRAMASSAPPSSARAHGYPACCPRGMTRQTSAQKSALRSDWLVRARRRRAPRRPLRRRLAPALREASAPAAAIRAPVIRQPLAAIWERLRPTTRRPSWSRRVGEPGKRYPARQRPCAAPSLSPPRAHPLLRHTPTKDRAGGRSAAWVGAPRPSLSRAFDCGRRCGCVIGCASARSAPRPAAP